MDINNIIIFAGAGLALNITPGPDMMFIITRSISEGKWAGIVSAFGVSAGCIVHITAISFGLSGLLLAVPTAYDIIKYLGAGYLVYLGIKVLITGYKFQSENIAKKNLRKIFWQGALTNILNPKVALFFLAFLPQFITPSGNITLQLLFLGILFNINGTIVNILVALFAGKVGNYLKSKLTNSSIFKWITASVFIGLGIRLAFLERK